MLLLQWPETAHDWPLASLMQRTWWHEMARNELSSEASGWRKYVITIEKLNAIIKLNMKIIMVIYISMPVTIQFNDILLSINIKNNNMNILKLSGHGQIVRGVWAK